MRGGAGFRKAEKVAEENSGWQKTITIHCQTLISLRSKPETESRYAVEQMILEKWLEVNVDLECHAGDLELHPAEETGH